MCRLAIHKHIVKNLIKAKKKKGNPQKKRILTLQQIICFQSIISIRNKISLPKQIDHTTRDTTLITLEEPWKEKKAPEEKYYSKRMRKEMYIWSNKSFVSVTKGLQLG